MDELSNNYDKKKDQIRSTRPITIRQAKNATEKDDQKFFIDEKEVNNVVIVGVVRHAVKNDMFMSYLIEDGTGSIDVRLFNSIERDINTGIQIDKYVQVHGRLNSFNRQNLNIAANGITLIVDHNQITYHTLDVIHTHLILSKVPTIEQAYMGEDNFHVTIVKKAILECSNTDRGAYMYSVIENLKGRIAEPHIREIVDNLLNRGEVFTTTDDYHLKLV